MRNWLLIITGVTVSAMQPLLSDTRYSVERKFIQPPQFKAGAPYTPGVLVGETLYISGQLDRNPQTGQQPAGVAARTRMAMDNVGRVLRAAGMDYGNVVSCHVQLADMGHYKEMNEVYGSYFGPDHYPARTTLEFPGLPGGASIEITCIAFADKSRISSVVPPVMSRASIWRCSDRWNFKEPNSNPETEK